MDLRKIVSESIDYILNENRVVTFDGEVYPRFGWCVILAGGGGSGKGFMLNHSIPINGKIINIDSLQSLYIKMNNNMIQGEKYDSLNPSHVNYLHNSVKKSNLKGRYTSNIFDKDSHYKERLPNVIFDMVAKNPGNDVINVAKKAKLLGYKTMLVWVVSNRHEALLRNLSRPRRIPDEILHNAHNALSKNMPTFLNSSLASTYLDESWILLGSSEGINKSDLSGDDAKNMAFSLPKSSSGFIINDIVMKKLKKYLGLQEKNPKNSQTYLSSDEIAKKYGKKNYDKKGNFLGYKFDREQFDYNTNFYK